MAEDIGVGGRAGYYDGIGAARDVIQNHLLQLLALTAMEEPISFDADAPPRREGEGARGGARCPKTSRSSTARGQYAGGWQGGEKVLGFLEEDGMNPDVHHRDLRGDQARDRHPALGGRAVLPAHRQAARAPRHRDRRRVQARARSTCSPRSQTSELGQNALVIRVQPDEGVTIRFGSKVPGAGTQVRDVTMDFGYGHAFTEASPEAYERLILDVLLGDPPLFPRHQEVELSLEDPRPHRGVLGDAGRPARAVQPGFVGPGIRRRAPRPRRPRLEAPMIVDLPDTTIEQGRPRPSSSVREEGGAVALGRVLTLVIATRAAPRRRRSRPRTTPPASTRCASSCSMLGDERRRRGTAPRRADPRRRRRRRERGRRAARLRRPRHPIDESLVTGLLLPDAPVVVWWPGETPAVPVDSRRSARIAQRRITDAATQADPAAWLAIARRNVCARRHRLRLDPPDAVARTARRRARPAAVRAGHRRRGARRGRLALDRAAGRLAAAAARCAGRLRVHRRRGSGPSGIKSVRLTRAERRHRAGAARARTSPC